MEQKYWWLSYQDTNPLGSKSMEDRCSTVHPFIYIANMQEYNPHSQYSLISWRSISVEEFNLFNELNDINIL